MSIAHVPNTFTIRSGQGDYDVVTCSSLRQGLSFAQTGDVFAVVDERVHGLHPDLAELFDAQRTYLLPATEDEKTLQGVERLCRFLQQKSASKRSQLVVVGGGITQDIGTFAAHIYYRGIPFTYVPTTLLAMADSCIGAKCAVNLGEFKNQLGFFQSPASVVVWPGFLKTLSTNDVRSGFGEIVKLAITSGSDDYGSTERHLNERGFDLEEVQTAIVRSLETKRRVIEQDEYEKDLRRTLNYGHTFGHALESLTQHEVPHGLAVAWGIDVANYVAMRSELLDTNTFERVHSLLARHFGFATRASYDAPTLVAAMRRDKKAAGSTVTLILPQRLGGLRIVPRELDASLESDLQGYLMDYDIFTRVSKGSPAPAAEGGKNAIHG